MERKAAIKPVADKRRREMSEYIRLTKSWLKLPENRVCAVCLVRSLEQGAIWAEVKDVIVRRGVKSFDRYRLKESEEVHHYRGRIGRLLCDSRFFIATCRDCREWPHENGRAARALGLLAPAAEWEVFPGPEVEGFPATGK